jgi:3alpha(or 20beta)-hydroxysteroid dehydrogenase
MNASAPAFDGRVIVVTGGCGGIGAAVARRLVADCGRVAIADLNEDAGAALAEELGHDRAFFVHCDVSSEGSISKAFDTAADRFGALHGAVCAAGIVAHSHTTPLVDITTQEFDDTCAINLRGTFISIQACARTIKRLGGEGGGSIVTIASVAGLRGSAAIDPSYSVTKFAVIGLTQVAAAKLCKDKIRVNCVSPTSVETPMTAAVGVKQVAEMGEEQAKVVAEQAMAMLCPLHHRMVSPESMAGVICFLLGDAAGDLTGVNLPVDQGYGAGANGLM